MNRIGSLIQTIHHALHPYRVVVNLVIFWILATYAWEAVQEAVAAPVTEWMHIYSFRDYTHWDDIKTYLRELRTGIPPVLSFLELHSWMRYCSIEWIIEDLYRYGIVFAVLLPGFFAKGTLRSWLLATGIGWLMLESILIVHPGNPQLYDVLLPVFILLGFLYAQISLKTKWVALGIVPAVLGGFFFSMAELARPFMIALLPILIAICGYQYFQARRRWLFVAYLLPILIFSGGWHLKLLIYNQGQVVWSNHGGTNLFRAWTPVIDHKNLTSQIQPEAPPLNEYGWAWNNLNTQIHAENSAFRSKAVVGGILNKPELAGKILYQKIRIFTTPRTYIYKHDPQDPLLIWYRTFVRGLYYVLAILLVVSLVKTIRNWRFLFSWEFGLLFTTFFLTVMPIIGESGEEARFIVAVLPFLITTGLIAARWGEDLLRWAIKKGTDKWDSSSS
ncbi:MAG: hypothetical protein AAF587_09420 [Bacteroidota bacterium]